MTVIHQVVHAVALTASLATVPPLSWTPPLETLISVGNDGKLTVQEHLGHHACAEAVSLALNGMSVEQAAAWDKEQNDLSDQLLTMFKPHAPGNADEKMCMEEARSGAFMVIEDGSHLCVNQHDTVVDTKKDLITRLSVTIVSPIGTQITYSPTGSSSWNGMGSGYQNVVREARCIPND